MSLHGYTRSPSNSDISPDSVSNEEGCVSASIKDMATIEFTAVYAQQTICHMQVESDPLHFVISIFTFP